MGLIGLRDPELSKEGSDKKMSMPRPCTTNGLAAVCVFRRPGKLAFVLVGVVRLGVVPGVTRVRRNRLQALVSRSIRRSVCAWRRSGGNWGSSSGESFAKMHRQSVVSSCQRGYARPRRQSDALIVRAIALSAGKDKARHRALQSSPLWRRVMSKVPFVRLRAGKPRPDECWPELRLWRGFSRGSSSGESPPLRTRPWLGW